MAHWYGLAPGRLPLVCHARRPRSYTVFSLARGIPNRLANTPLLNFRFGYVLWNSFVQLDFFVLTSVSVYWSFRRRLTSSFSRKS